MKEHYQVVIVGGGTAGITVAAQLDSQTDLSVALIEPSSKHYYQPIWTLVGGGVLPKEESERETADYIPHSTTWIQDAVDTFQPDANTVTTKEGKTIGYDYLIVCAGIQLDWDGVKGLKGNVGKHGICSNYAYDTVDSTWENLRNFSGGRAIFTHPNTPIKCGGAPQKICYLAEDYFRKQGIRDKCEVVFIKPGAAIFGITKYANALDKVVKRKEIVTHYKHHLIELRPEKKEAVFANVDGGDNLVLSYDMIHVTPPMSAPDFLKKSPITNDEGWVDVDAKTLQHNTYKNVFSLGDCSSLPTAKTGAAVRKQAPILLKNLLAHREGKAMTAHYDGYTSCPLVTGYGSLILAEFDYDGNPAESFPFDQAQERYSMYALKLYGLPQLYWHGMLRGRA